MYGLFYVLCYYYILIGVCMWIRISQLLLTTKNIALIGVGIGLCIAMINSLVNFGFIAWLIFKAIVHMIY